MSKPTLLEVFKMNESMSFEPDMRVLVWPSLSVDDAEFPPDISDDDYEKLHSSYESLDDIFAEAGFKQLDAWNGPPFVLFDPAHWDVNEKGYQYGSGNTLEMVMSVLVPKSEQAKAMARDPKSWIGARRNKIDNFFKKILLTAGVEMTGFKMSDCILNSGFDTDGLAAAISSELEKSN